MRLRLPFTVAARLMAGLAALSCCAGLVHAADLPANATTVFLGQRSEWRDVMIVAHQSSALFGSREYYISGAGQIVVVDVRVTSDVGAVETHFKFEGRSVDVDTVIERISEADVLAVRPEELDRPPPTCSSVPVLILRNGYGETRSVPFPRVRPTEAYEKAWLEVAALHRLTQDVEPTYTGEYRRDYIPERFDWSAPDIIPHRPNGWSIMPTEQQRARAEQEFHEKVEIQLREIERVQADQETPEQRD